MGPNRALTSDRTEVPTGMGVGMNGELLPNMALEWEVSTFLDEDACQQVTQTHTRIEVCQSHRVIHVNDSLFYFKF